MSDSRFRVRFKVGVPFTVGKETLTVHKIGQIRMIEDDLRRYGAYVPIQLDDKTFCVLCCYKSRARRILTSDVSHVALALRSSIAMPEVVRVPFRTKVKLFHPDGRVLWAILPHALRKDEYGDQDRLSLTEVGHAMANEKW